MNRVKVSITVDPRLLSQVDEFVEGNAGLDRSKVIDQALLLWSTSQQARAMEAQFADEPGATDDEWEGWRSIRRSGAARRLRRT